MWFNAYLSGDGAGFAAHFDANIATTLQIEGSKLWRFSRRPALPWPPANGGYMPDGSCRFINEATEGGWPDPKAAEAVERIPLDEFDEVLLEPGDVLMLPAGTWHSAKAGGYSLALNLAFKPNNFAQVVATLIERRFVYDPNWRGVAPLLPSLPQPPGAPPLRATYVRYVKERLAELQDFLASLEPEDSELVESWACSVLGASTTEASGGEQAATVAPAPTARLRLNPNRAVYAVALADRRVSLFAGDGQIVASDKTAYFLRRLLEVRSFTATDARAWTEDGSLLSWEAVAKIIESLTSQGILVPC
jgi:hypothetical protein